MQIVFTKGVADDAIEARRDDGSEVHTSFPHKGPVPHDAVHFFVEFGLGIERGFWGMVAEGRHPEDIAATAKAFGHASASRPGIPDASIVQIVQAERIVECFEADLWSGGGDPETLRDVIRAGCEQSLLPTPQLSDAEIETVRRAIGEFHDRWAAIPVGGSCRLEWRESRAAA